MSEKEATTPDLVALTRLRYEIMDRDLNFDAIADFYLPDAVMGRPDDGPFTLEGVDAIGEFLEDYWGTWEEHHHYIEEVLDLGHGVVFASVSEDGRLKGSSSIVEGRSASIIERVEGKIARHVVYSNADEARAAAERLEQERADG